MTLQNDWETLYVSGEKTDSAKDPPGETVSERLAKEESYVLVDGDKRTERAGTEPGWEPVVKGVVVVCEGGDDPPDRPADLRSGDHGTGYQFRTGLYHKMCIGGKPYEAQHNLGKKQIVLASLVLILGAAIYLN